MVVAQWLIVYTRVRPHTYMCFCWLQIVELVRLSTAGNVLSLSLDSAGELLVTGGEAKLLQVWNLERSDNRSGAPCVTSRATRATSGRDNRTSVTFAGASNGASDVRAHPVVSIPQWCCSRESPSLDFTTRSHRRPC